MCWYPSASSPTSTGLSATVCFERQCGQSLPSRLAYSLLSIVLGIVWPPMFALSSRNPLTGTYQPTPCGMFDKPQAAFLFCQVLFLVNPTPQDGSNHSMGNFYLQYQRTLCFLVLDSLSNPHRLIFNPFQNGRFYFCWDMIK